MQSLIPLQLDREDAYPVGNEQPWLQQYVHCAINCQIDGWEIVIVLNCYNVLRWPNCTVYI